MNVWEVAGFAVGSAVVASVVFSAVRTVAVPRGEVVRLSQALFWIMRPVFDGLARMARSTEQREAIRARYAPLTMLMLPGVWAVGVIGGFTVMYWTLGVRGFRDALVLSGSSFTTLGFRSTESTFELLLAIVEALLGLGLIALLLSFMPALYAAFSRREALVARLEVRAGSPADPEEFIVRAHRIGWLDELGDTWVTWEQWFVEVEEAHITYPALNWFRSPVASRSWVSASGAVLDAAALMQSTVDAQWSPEASLCIRSGYVALRRIGGFFDVDFDPDPKPNDPISVTRAEWDRLYDRLDSQGVPLRRDRDQAWRDYAGWRVTYDEVLLGMAAIVDVKAGDWPSW